LKRLRLTILLLIISTVCACGAPAQAPEPTAEPEPSATVAPQIPTPDPAPTAPPPSPPPTPSPEPHSELFIPGLSVEDVIVYFNEVCLDAEFSTGGNPNVVQKWVSPIRYALHGDYNENDIMAIRAFSQWLNTIEGFPGMAEADSSVSANLDIHYCSQQEMVEIMGDTYANLDGAVTFWYEDNEIYDETICCRNDIDAALRNSVTLEEIYNGLGPVQDTELRSDSIIYSYFSRPQALSDVDKLLLKLLYHPDIHCGMDIEQCESVIRTLYY